MELLENHEFPLTLAFTSLPYQCRIMCEADSEQELAGIRDG